MLVSWLGLVVVPPSPPKVCKVRTDKDLSPDLVFGGLRAVSWRQSCDWTGLRATGGLPDAISNL